MKQFSVPVQDHFPSLDLEPIDLLVLSLIWIFRGYGLPISSSYILRYINWQVYLPYNILVSLRKQAYSNI